MPDIDINNKIFENPRYKNDIQLFSVLERIKSTAFLLISDGESYVAARNSNDKPAWIWTDGNPSREAAAEIAAGLRRTFGSGVTAFTAKREAAHALLHELGEYEAVGETRLVAQRLDNLIEPQKIGEFRLPRAEERNTVIDFIYNINLEGLNERSLSGAKEAADKCIEDERLFVLEEGGELSGCAGFSAPQNGFMNVGPVYVRPSRRNRGCAAYMVACLSKMIIEQGYVPSLYTDGSNPASNRAYEKVGFVRTGEIVEVRLEKK